MCLDCELDSGTNDSVISDKLCYKHFSCKTLQSPNHNLCVITGQRLDILKKNLVKVNMGDKCFQAPITVIKVKSGFRPLIGRSWLDKFNPN